jgi:hypothetical protein
MKKESLEVLYIVIVTIFLTIITNALMIMLAVK